MNYKNTKLFIFVASKEGKKNIVELLLANSTNAHIYSENRETPLHKGILKKLGYH